MAPFIGRQLPRLTFDLFLENLALGLAGVTLLDGARSHVVDYLDLWWVFFFHGEEEEGRRI